MSDDKYKRNLDRDRGIQPETFSELLTRAGHGEKEQVSVNPPDSDVWPRRPGSDDRGDPYGSQIKPKGVPVWTHKPVTPAEEALYYGDHIHSESNPLGLHTHVPGGSLSGGHSHSPQNIFGVHHHKDDSTYTGPVSLDGTHTHEGKNYPDGSHDHEPDNFG